MSALRDELGDAARNYLRALDRLDLETVSSAFADDADFIVQSANLEVRGRTAIREMWDSFFRSHDSMEHRILGVVIDDQQRRVATEQAFTGVLKGGETESRHSVYIFDVDDTGRFSRAIVWIDGETPARSTE